MQKIPAISQHLFIMLKRTCVILRFFIMSSHASVIAVGRQAPAFSGTAFADGQFKELSLGDYKGKYLVLFFYPLDFTFVCPTEILAFNEKYKEF